MVALASTAVVILAAGLSRRYGTPNKLLADFNGKPLARHIAETLSVLPFQQRIAVCPRNDCPLSDLFSEWGFDIALNADPKRGQASSVAAGVALATQRDPGAILICLADMPLVSAAMITNLVEALDVNDSIGVVASIGIRGGVIGPPAVFAPLRFGALMNIQGDVGARGMLHASRSISVADKYLLDLDSQDDFLAGGAAVSTSERTKNGTRS